MYYKQREKITIGVCSDRTESVSKGFSPHSTDLFIEQTLLYGYSSSDHLVIVQTGLSFIKMPRLKADEMHMKMLDTYEN